MKNKTLRILVSIASVLSAICSTILFVIFFRSFILGAWNSLLWMGTAYNVTLIAGIISALCFCLDLSSVLTFLYVNCFLVNGSSIEYKTERDKKKKAKKKELLEKLKSELGEE